MLQFLQILQISLFILTVLGLILLGLLILIKPVLIFHRRLYILVFLPLLLANLLALFEGCALLEETPSLDWRLWLVLAFDLGLLAAGFGLLKGWLVYGLTEDAAADALQAWFTAQNWEVNPHPGVRNTWWGGKRQALCIQVEGEDQTDLFWVLSQGSEVRLQGETRQSEKRLAKALPALRRIERPYHLQDHLSGVLYIVLAVVLVVLGWIFFFEPRLILIN
jgi:hypothetical protein